MRGCVDETTENPRRCEEKLGIAELYCTLTVHIPYYLPNNCIKYQRKNAQIDSFYSIEARCCIGHAS